MSAQHPVDLQIGQERAEGRAEPRIERHHHALHPHHVRDAGPMQRSGTAKGNQHELTRVEAAIDGEDAQGIGHVLVGDVNNGLGSLVCAEPEPPAKLLHLGTCAIDVQCNLPPRK